MKLSTWMNLNDLKPNAVAKLFKVPHANVYKYLYEKAIPRRSIMKRIYEITLGLVTANDFYELNPEELEQKLLKQKLEKDEQEK